MGITAQYAQVQYCPSLWQCAPLTDGSRPCLNRELLVQLHLDQRDLQLHFETHLQPALQDEVANLCRRIHLGLIITNGRRIDRIA